MGYLSRHFTLGVLATLAAAACALAPLQAAAQAQKFPNRPIKLIVPVPPGGGVDLLARSIGGKMADRLGVPVLIENRAGASAAIGTEALAKSPPDGYTIMMGYTVHATNALFNPKLPYDTLKDFQPLVYVSYIPLVLVTPPREDGSIAPELLAAAHAVGVTEVYRVGGIPAIAALACGTPTIRSVDKIVGPGNLYVTLAKRHAYGRVDIDMLAGPSEILIIADESANPAFVAADLLSQAEHDTLAMAVCLTIGSGVASNIQQELSHQIDSLPEERRAVAAESIRRFGRLIRCADFAQAVGIANRIAPEHLELQVKKPKTVFAQLTNAGAIFVGPWSPEPIGDYVAGPSHTLPTGGTARMWSGIGVDTFLRRTSIVNFSEADFRHCADAGLILARGEGLEAHARSIEIRLRG